MHNMKVIEIFGPFHKAQIRPHTTNGSGVMITTSWEVLLEINSGQIKLSGQLWTLSPLPKEFWENSEDQNRREFRNLSNDG
jgi:hypothetical protein